MKIVVYCVVTIEQTTLTERDMYIVILRNICTYRWYYIGMYLHRGMFTYRYIYIKTNFHRDVFTSRHIHMQMYSHTDICT